MQGFDEEFTDIVQYIIAITHRIWEEKAIGYIYHYYPQNTVIHTSSGYTYGRDEVIAATVQALAAFPDRRLFGDEVIWEQRADNVYYSSHRLMHAGTNHGATVYAAATGRKVRYYAVADCLVKDNQIVEEWLVRDELLLLAQLGLDAHKLAKELAQAEAQVKPSVAILGEVERLRGQLPPPEPTQADPAEDIETWVRALFHEIWNWRLLNRVNDYYHPALHTMGASGRNLHGHGAYKAFLLSLLSPFPDLALSVEHVCAIPESEGRTRVATRWTMQGTHTGPGIYGKPTGKPISILGMTHQVIEAGQVVREWCLFDEFALLKQLYAPG